MEMEMDMMMMLELAHDYCDRADVIVVMDDLWFINTLDRLALENDIDLTDEMMDKLVGILMEEY